MPQIAIIASPGRTIYGDGVITVSPVGNNRGRTDPRWDPLFPMGSSALSYTYSCRMDLRCVNCCNSIGQQGFRATRLNADCTIHYDLNDKFENPFDKNGAHASDLNEASEARYWRCYNERIRRCDKYIVVGPMAYAACERGVREECRKIAYPQDLDVDGATPYYILAQWDDRLTVHEDLKGQPCQIPLPKEGPK